MAGIDVTVVVPVCNEAAVLPDLLRALHDQTRPGIRTLIVDAGSIDETCQVASDLITHYPEVELISAGTATPGRARNIGIEEADTEWVLLVDAGMQAETTLVEHLVNARDRMPSASVILGSCSCETQPSWRAAAIITTLAPRANTGGSWTRFGLVPCLLRRRAWRAAGGIPDWRAGEDKEFLRRLESSGAEIGYSSESDVTWDIAESRGRLFRKWRVYEYHDAVHGESWHRPAVAYNLLGVLLSGLVIYRIGWAGVLVLLFPHIVRTSIRYWRHRKQGDSEVPLRPLVFVEALIMSVMADVSVAWGYCCYLLGRAPREWGASKRT
jgi:glycosyltransferase involved in cell wall biosynthesis